MVEVEATIAFTSSSKSTALLMVIGEDIDDGVDLRPPSGGGPRLEDKVTPCPRNSRPDSGQLVILEAAICSGHLRFLLLATTFLSRLRTILSMALLTLSRL